MSRKHLCCPAFRQCSCRPALRHIDVQRYSPLPLPLPPDTEHPVFRCKLRDISVGIAVRRWICAVCRQLSHRRYRCAPFPQSKHCGNPIIAARRVQISVCRNRCTVPPGIPSPVQAPPAVVGILPTSSKAVRVANRERFNIIRPPAPCCASGWTTVFPPSVLHQTFFSRKIIQAGLVNA